MDRGCIDGERAFAVRVRFVSTAVQAAQPGTQEWAGRELGMRFTIFPNAGGGRSTRRDTEQTKRASAGAMPALCVARSSEFFDDARARVAFVHDVRRAGEEA